MPEGFKHFSKTKPMRIDHFKECIEWWNDRKEIKDTDTDTFKAKQYLKSDIEKLEYDIDQCGYPSIEEEVLSPRETVQIFHEKRDSLNAKIDRKLKEISDFLGIEL